MDEACDGMAALEVAIERAGGVGALALSIGASLNAPSMWRKRGRVPADYCPAIERETGVTCERLRPDVAWSVLRSTPQDEPLAPPAIASEGVRA